jgi:parvulin-like peptidyl-prolyl isomerase
MKHLYYIVVSIVLCICFVTFGCGSREEAPETSEEQASEDMVSRESQEAETPSLSEDTIAVVNGQAITKQELTERLHAALKQLDVSSPPDEYTLNQRREEVLTELIEKTLIAQQAKAQNITVTDEEFQQVVKRVQDEYGGVDIRTILQEQGKSYNEWEKAQRERVLLDKLIDLSMDSMVAVTDEEVRQYYERNNEKYDHPTQIRASQILTYEKEVAEKAFQEIRSGVDFAEVAKKYSESPDAQNGGDLGFFAKGDMPPEFDEVIFSLKMGEVSKVVKTPYGYQIFKLTGQREAHRVSFEDAKEQIKTMLRKQKRMFAFDFWIAEIRENSEIILNQKLIKQVK